MSDTAIVSRLGLAKQIAVSAGKLTLNYFQTPGLSVEKKGDGSPLTIADRSAETHLREQITAVFPDDAILGEEFDDKSGTSGIRWILDPIDGTKSFISGVPLYGTMVAVEKDGECVIGVLYFPGLDEGIFACTGSGAFSFRGSDPPVRATVSTNADIGNSVLVTSEAEAFDERGASSTRAALANSVYFARTWGDAYGYYLVATGRVDIMIDPELNIWDAAAVKPIIEEAGGTFTDWSGKIRVDSGDAIGTNGAIHQQVLDIVRDTV